MKPQFPTVQEQINYWNKKEGEELERVSRIQEESLDKRDESRDATNETREVNQELLSVCKEFVRVMEDPRTTAAMPHTVAKARKAIRHAGSIASNPQEPAATTAKTLTEDIGKANDFATLEEAQEEERREDCARWFDDKEQADVEYLDERDARWNAVRNL